MDINFENAHPEQIVFINGNKKIWPRPEFILDDGSAVRDVTDCPGIILRTDNSDEDNKYRVECHAVKDDEFRSEIAPEHLKTFDTEEEALEYGTEMLGEKIPTAEKGIINEIDFTEV